MAISLSTFILMTTELQTGKNAFEGVFFIDHSYSLTFDGGLVVEQT